LEIKWEIKMTTFLKSTAVLLSMGAFDYCLANAATQQQAMPVHGEFFLAQVYPQETIDPSTIYVMGINSNGQKCVRSRYYPDCK